MITIKYTYKKGQGDGNITSLSEFLKLKSEEEDFEYEFKTFDEEHYKEKKEAFKIKGGFGARLTPFCVIYKDKEPLKAFYSEAGECTLSRIVEYLEYELI